ncbi:hypothetical protein NUU61_006655 [Penicillium alfredii]|uniref:BZIP domain-containing protein n=1 Tax=Penicillium alfredii TaxID=1506179 RepID=A0A9W9K3U2_9EURO|nr:uncharacterized protein NUU61_006655 [Penicillium alfredii]KAJ5091785.1 hypothetical protein NUU61_006655 [Penicillium alfredii]
MTFQSTKTIKAKEETLDMPMQKLDAVERRKLQNRLNQRASRKRRALQNEKENKDHRKWIVYIEKAECHPAVTQGIAKKNATQSSQAPPTQRHCTDELSFCAARRTLRYEFWYQLEARVLDAAINLVQSPALLPAVMQYNIIWAMLTNATSMGITKDLLDEDIASQFNIPGPMKTLHLPPSLVPTPSQKTIIHHPWIDLIPIPSFRNALLSKMESYDEEDMCRDFYGTPSEEGGLVVWGESWDPRAYEISERVARKFGWIFRECPEILQSTNYWRERREERPLIVEEVE